MATDSIASAASTLGKSLSEVDVSLKKKSRKKESNVGLTSEDMNMVKDVVNAAVSNAMAVDVDLEDDISPVKTGRIGEGDLAVYNRPPTPFNDHDTSNLRSVLHYSDALYEVKRNEMITVMQGQASMQSAGLLRNMVQAVENTFAEMSANLTKASEDK